ncbi:MAG: Ig-like domain-containing protein [Pseudohongiellaceae bacterium]
MFPFAAHAQTELLQNGSAESNTVDDDAETIDNWTEDPGTGHNNQWGAYPPEDPFTGFSFTAQDGDNVFIPWSVDNAGANIWLLFQTVDVSSDATAIDNGNVTIDFSGYIRSANGSGDLLQIRVQFLDAGDNEIQAYSSGFINNEGSWQNLTDSRTAPNGTRSIKVILEADNSESTSGEGTGDFVDGGFDNLSLTKATSNVAPSVGNFGGDSLAYNEGDGAEIIDQGNDATVTDADSGSFDGGNLTLTISAGEDAAEDVLSIANVGGVLLPATSAGTPVTVGGLGIGTLGNAIAAGNDLVVNFSALATPARVQSLVRALTYENTDTSDPTTGARTVRLTVNDGDGATSTATDATVTVNGVNDEPTLAATGQNPTFTEGGSAVGLYSAVTASTVEAGQTLTSMTLTVTNVNDGSDERLSFDGSTLQLTNGFNVANTATSNLDVSVSVAGTTATVSFSDATLTPAALATLVDNLSYENLNTNPDTSNRVVTLTSLTDSGSNVNPDDNVATLAIASTVTIQSIDNDGDVTAAGTVTEPVGLATTIDTAGEAVDVFDFTLSDGGGSDALTLDVTQVVVNVSGTSTDTDRGKVTWRLDGLDTSNVAGVYNAGTDTITFSGLAISVADGNDETYTINAFYNDNTGLTEDRTFVLSIDGDSDLTVDGAGTQMGATTPVNNGTGSTIDVVPTALAFTTQPAGSVSGIALTTQPVVAARDAFGNTDVDFTETVSVTEASAGSLSNHTQAATNGVATFTSLTYTATADQENFTLTANDQDGVGSNLPTADSNAVTSDVVATQLIFSTQPAPTSVISGQATAFTTVPVVSARDGNSIVDTGYSTDIALAEVNGAGSATLTGTDDTDGSAATVSITPASGVATFADLQITYTNIGASETFNLRTSSGGLSTADSNQFTSASTPTVTDGNISISGASGIGDAFKIGDTVTATWNNTGGGDNNADVTGVTVDFSQFGGGAAVVASDSSDTWTATYTVVAGAIDATNRNVSVTATNATGPTTIADTSNATVDNSAPTLTDGNISISGASGIDGAYKIGDTVTATWNNTAGGDNNSDTLSSVTVDFSQFGGGAAVVASNTADTWTATYTIVAGALDDTNLNISLTAIDNAGNVTTAADTANATVDTRAPSVDSVSLPANATYIAGQNLEFTVNYSETVTVNTGGGTPRLELTIGAATRHAAYVSGSDSGALLFRYTVQAGDNDAGGITLDATLDVNGGSIRDGVGNDASANLGAFGSLASVLVDTQAPSVNSVSLPSSGSYIAGQNLDFTVNYDDAVTVDTTGGIPRLELTVGAVTRYAAYVSGSETNALLFRYTVQPGDNDSDGITLSTPLQTNGGTLRDTVGNDAATALGAIGSLASVLVDTQVPSVDSVTVPNNATYMAGQNLDFTVNTDEAVTVNTDGGTPRLQLTVGAATRFALYESGSGTMALLFRYTVQAGDNDNDGISLDATLDANGGTLRDAAGNDLVLTNAIADTAAVLVDTTVPATPAAPDLAAGSDSGSSDSDDITSDQTPTLNGTAEADSLVSITSSEDGLLDTVSADGSGDWSFTPVTDMTQADHELTVKATDAGGNVSAASTALEITIDATAPAITGVSFDQADVNGTNLEAVSVTLAGAEVGATLNYTITSSGGGGSVTGSMTVTDAEEQITGLDVSDLPDGTLTISVILTDTAGNVSPAVTDTVVKDADPVLVLPADPAAIVDGDTAVIAGVSVSDTASSSITVELSVATGTIDVTGGGGATITGNGSAAVTVMGTLLQINDALAGLSFTAAVNSTTDQTLNIEVDDGVGSASGALTIEINDRPDIDNLSGTITFTIDGEAVLLDQSPLAAVSDLDNAHFNGGTLTIGITAGAVPAQDLLSFNTAGLIALAGTTAGSDVLVDGTVVGTLGLDIVEGNDLVLNLNADATPANVALLLQALSYDNTAVNPTTGTRTVTITLDDGLAERVVSLNVSVAFPPPPAPSEIIIDTIEDNQTLNGTVTVTSDGVLNGGDITGTINNSGLITGDVSLGADTTINGGTITGNITGDPGQPAQINDAHIGAGASLSNVVIGAGTTLDAGVTLGENVKFESADSIPPGLDLTHALSSLNWNTGDARSVPFLDEEVLTSVSGEDPMTIIRAIQLMGDFEPAGNNVDQNPANGEIVVVTADFQASVLPVRVSQAVPGEPEGVYINEDGDIVFVTVNRRVVLSHPVLVNAPAFLDILAAMGLQLDYNDRANLVVEPGSGGAQPASLSGVPGQLGLSGVTLSALTNDIYYSGRPDVLAVPAHRGDTAGVVRFPIAGLGGFLGVSMIFEGDDGALLEQDIVPVPADWVALKAAIAAMPGASDVRISSLGVISVNLDGTIVRGMMDFTVNRGEAPADGELQVNQVGDLTGNGVLDYEIVFGDGERQLLFVFE